MNFNSKQYLGKRTLTASAGFVSLACLAGCSAGDPAANSEEDVAAVQSQVINDSIGAQYESDCLAVGVPLPPPWGQDKTAANPTTTPIKPWTLRGSYKDSYNASLNGTIYTAQLTGPSGLCVINAHVGGGLVGLFDIICQGNNGKTCFWEGGQPPGLSSKTVPMRAGSTWAPAGSGSTPIGAGGPSTRICTHCHGGQNAFLSHRLAGHPLDLNGINYWMPPWYDPLTPTATAQNPGPETFAGYPASTSATSCLTCHTSSTSGAGGFPRLSQAEIGQSFGDSSYCAVLKEVTSRPGSTGGMPPNANCRYGIDCAAQTDPFVMAMLSTCQGIATSRANSPVAIEASAISTPYKGTWAHLVASKGIGSAQMLVQTNNIYVNNSYQGWSSTDISSLNSNYRAAMWIQGTDVFDTEGSKIAVASTDIFGSIWEKVSGAGRKSVTSNSPTSAAGSPSGYIRNDNVNAVVFRGIDNYIYESTWNGSSTWSTNKLPGQTVQAEGDPIGYRTEITSRVVYKCGLRLICEERLVNGAWSFRSISTIADIRPFVPMPFADQFWSDKEIFYTGTDGVHVLLDNCEPNFCTATDTLIYKETNVVSAPMPYNNQDSGTNLVFVVDPGYAKVNSVVELTKLNNSAPWTSAVIMKTSETLVGDPGVVPYTFEGTGVNTVFVRNSANKLYQLRWDFSANKYAKTTITL